MMSKIVAGIRVLHICGQKLAQCFPVKYVDAHRCQIALWVLRLFFEFNDLSALVSVHDAETAGLPDGNLDNGDSSFGILCLMLCQHLGIVHLIDMISGTSRYSGS